MATEKRREEKNESSSIGWVELRSQSTKHVRISAAVMSATSTIGDVQDRAGASMTPQSSRPKPMMESPPPIGSGRLLVGFFELGTSHAAAASPQSAMGTLTRNTDPHQ